MILSHYIEASKYGVVRDHFWVMEIEICISFGLILFLNHTLCCFAAECQSCNTLSKIK